jgi:hypothetical protein
VSHDGVEHRFNLHVEKGKKNDFELVVGDAND